MRSFHNVGFGLLLILSLGIAACGGSDDETTDGSGDGSPDSGEPGVSCSLSGGQQYILAFLRSDNCSICDEWQGDMDLVRKALDGDSVMYVEFDFTSAATTAAAKSCAEGLGLAELFAKYEGVTGEALLIDSKNPLEVMLSVDTKEYPTADHQIEAIRGTLNKKG